MTIAILNKKQRIIVLGSEKSKASSFQTYIQAPNFGMSDLYVNGSKAISLYNLHYLHMLGRASFVTKLCFCFCHHSATDIHIHVYILWTHCLQYWLDQTVFFSTSKDTKTK